MARVQLALNVTDMDAAVEFYRKLFATDPVKGRGGYANSAIDDPLLKLVLIENPPGRSSGVIGALNHLGVEVATADGVRVTARRLTDDGHETAVQDSPSCCFAIQHKVWTNDPDGVPWEFYTVLADTPERDAVSPPMSCC